MVDDSVNTAEIHGWLDRMKLGDSKALDEMFRRISSRMERIARNLLKRFARVSRWTDAADIAQSASLRLIRALREVRPANKRQFYALAATQIRREVLDLTRSLFGKEGLGANHESVQSKPGEANANWDPPCPEDQEELEKWVCFHEQAEKLPLEEREVVGLVFYHGWTQAEIADLFKVTTKTIQRRWQSALLKLRGMLSDWPVADE